MADDGYTVDNPYVKNQRTTKVATPNRFAHIGYLRCKIMEIPKDAFKSNNSRLSRGYVPVDVFTIDDDDEDAAETVYGICWTRIPHADTCQQAGALFASIIGAFAPQLLKATIQPLEQSGAKVNMLCVPSESEDAGYHFDLRCSYSNVEKFIFVGVSLILPFKRIFKTNYDDLVKKWVKCIGLSLGVDDARLTRIRYPLDFTRAEMVKSVFTGHRGIKQEILRYIMWACEQTGFLKQMAGYVSQVLAWNELEWVVHIGKVLVVSKSPVLNHPAVQDEVLKLKDAWNCILRSSYPRYFRYFCTLEEEFLIQRHNFKILGAVAQQLLNMKSKNNGSIYNFADKSVMRGALVQELVKLHVRFCGE